MTKQSLKVKKYVTGAKKNVLKMQTEIGQTTIAFVQMNFRNQGFTTNSGTNKWRKRKYETNKTRGKATLVSTGKMRAGFVIGGKSKNSVTIVNRSTSKKGFHYPVIHNDGIGGMPKRKMIGDSTRLRGMIGKVIKKRFFE